MMNFTDAEYVEKLAKEKGTTDEQELICQTPNEYIKNMRDGATAGFKYFENLDFSKIELEIRGRAKGRQLVSQRQKLIARKKICINSK